MIKLLTLAVAIAVIAGGADGRPNCKRGVPCGNTCISAGMECRMTPPVPSHASGAQATHPSEGPYRLDIDGRCFDANGRPAKQHLCAAAPPHG